MRRPEGGSLLPKAAFILDNKRLRVLYRSFTAAHIQLNVDELLRRVRAVRELALLAQAGQAGQLLAPAAWQPGHKIVPSTPDATASYYKQLAYADKCQKGGGQTDGPQCGTSDAAAQESKVPDKSSLNFPVKPSNSANRRQISDVDAPGVKEPTKKGTDTGPDGRKSTNGTSGAKNSAKSSSDAMDRAKSSSDATKSANSSSDATKIANSSSEATKSANSSSEATKSANSSSDAKKSANSSSEDTKSTKNSSGATKSANISGSDAKKSTNNSSDTKKSVTNSKKDEKNSMKK